METIEQEVARMAGVVKKAIKPTDRIGLISRLAVSKKFSDEAKPACLLYLVGELAKSLPDKHLSLLLENLQAQRVMATLNEALPEETGHVAGQIVRRVLTATEKTTNAMCQALANLEACNVTLNRVDMVTLALQSGMTEDQVGEVCELTWRWAYKFTDAQLAVSA